MEANPGGAGAKKKTLVEGRKGERKRGGQHNRAPMSQMKDHSDKKADR